MIEYQSQTPQFRPPEEPVLQLGDLVGGGLCLSHYHPANDTLSHDAIVNYQRGKVQKTVTSSTTLTVNDDVLLVDSSLANVVVTLPISGASGKEFIVFKTSSLNTVTIAPVGTDTVNGAATLVLTSNHSYTLLKSVMGGWVSVSSANFAADALTVTGGLTNTGTGAVATLGTELTTNGTFTGSVAGWVLGTNWVYGTNNVILTNLGASGTLSQNISVISGMRYVVSWTQTNSIDQNCHITPSIGSVSGSKCAQGIGAVTMSQILTANATGSLALAFTVTDITTSGTVTIDNVSVKLITEYAAHETIKHSSSDTRPTEIRHTWNGVNQSTIGIGYQAGYSNTTGYNNVFSGAGSGQSNTTGSNNTFSGANAGYSNTTGSANTFSGSSAGYSNTTGYNNVFSGAGSGQSNTTGSNNTFSGANAGYSNTTGSANTFNGINAGSANTTGSANTFNGVNAGSANTTGSANTFNGVNAGYSNTTGGQNTFSGVNAGNANTTGYNNVFSGVNAGKANTTGYQNTFSGADSGQSNTTGSGNTFSGSSAGNANTTGYNNTFSGVGSGYSNTTGYNNTCIGVSAGNDAVVTLTTQSNYVVFGNNSTTNANIKVAWTVTSDARDKCDFAPVPHGLEFINQLKPTSYFYSKSREDQTPAIDARKRYGFLAQDILAIEGSDSVIIDDRDPDNLKLNDQSLLTVLVKAVQELSAEVITLKAQLEAK